MTTQVMKLLHILHIQPAPKKKKGGGGELNGYVQ